MRQKPMERLKRVIGVYLIAVGAIVAVHTIIEPLYHTSTEAAPYTPNGATSTR